MLRRKWHGGFLPNSAHDKRLVAETLKSIPVERPPRTPGKRQYLCAEKGYDYPDIRELIAAWGYTAQIRSRREECAARKTIPGYRARRWIVERMYSRLNRFRRE
ncbi:hypothetical protein JCM17478_09080 [Thermopirellula anaerolimosa]